MTLPTGQGGLVPRVTVLMPAYQCAPYVAEAVDSVLAQTFRDFVLLVVDDGSTDGTWERLQTYRRDPRVRLEQQAHQGMAAGLNRGMHSADTVYIARMDADDRCAPGRLAAQVAFLDAHPEVDVVGTGYRPIDAAGVPGSTRDVLLRDADLRRQLYVASPFVHGSVLFRCDVVLAAGGYDAARWPAEDYDLWCRLGGGFANLPGPLYDYRVHPGGSSRDAQREQAARIAAELRARRPMPRATLPGLAVGSWVHRRELRWYLGLQRGLDRAARAPQPE